MWLSYDSSDKLPYSPITIPVIFSDDLFVIFLWFDFVIALLLKATLLIIHADAAAQVKIHTEREVVVSVTRHLLRQVIYDEARGLSRVTAEERSPEKSLKEP